MSEALDLFVTKLKDFEQLVEQEHNISIEDIKAGLQGLSKELKATPDLVFLLEPEQIGIMSSAAMLATGVKAELEATTKKKKKKVATKVTKKDKPIAILNPDDEVLF